MTVYQPTKLVFVDGDLLDVAFEAHTVHSLDNPVATATVVLALPRPASVLFNKVCEIQALIGNTSARIFQGVIRSDSDTLDENGMTATLNCQGWAYILAMPAIADTVWNGPIQARKVIVGVLRSYGFGIVGGPQYEVASFVDLDNELVLLGGNDDVDDGQVRWEAGESGLSFIQRICNLWGYSCFDCPDGIFRVRRCLGIPTATSSHSWIESISILTAARSRTADPVANWIDVTGASPLPADGSRPDPYHSAPSVVPANELIPEPGSKLLQISDDLLVSDEMCDTVRAVAELRYNSETPSTLVEWTYAGHPKWRPGNTILLTSDTIGVDEKLWLVSLSQDLTADGYWTTYTARRDTGTETPLGDEVCTTTTLIPDDEPHHLGDETVGYYDVPVAEDTEIHENFTPSNDFTSIRVTYEAHGVNSYLVGGGHTGSNVSRIRIEQPVGTIIGTAYMPIATETIGTPDWQDFDLPIPGNLDDGVAARLFITSGYNSAALAGPYDDFEIRNLVLYTCTEGLPDLPGEPTNPPIPVPTPPPSEDLCLVSLSGGTVPSGGVAFTISIPAFTIPAIAFGHSGLLKLSATLSGMTGDPGFPPFDEWDVPDQGIYWWTNGGDKPWLVPSSYTPGSPHTGTIFTGSGVGEYTWTFPSGAAQSISNGDIVLIARGTPYDYADLCLSFEDVP